MNGARYFTRLVQTSLLAGLLGLAGASVSMAQTAAQGKVSLPAAAPAPPAALLPAFTNGPGVSLPGLGALPGLPGLAPAPAAGGVVNALHVSDQPAGGPVIEDGKVTPASCASCACGGLNLPGPCPTTDCGSCCVPGRTHCCSFCAGDTPCERLLCGLYCCVCCPDPCYESRWIAPANAALWADSPRPVTQLRLHYDALLSIDRPDRAEYFMRQFPADRFASQADFHEFHLFTEVAPTPRFSFFIDLPWRSSFFEPAGGANTLQDTSRFGDMSVGTKSVWLDCELMLLTFQFTTFIPTGTPNDKGIGTGHVSLEPALLGALKFTPDLYLQFETAYWIPIGGGDVSGNVWHNHLSLNCVMCRILPDVQLIGTFEVVNYNVVYGGFTIDANRNFVLERDFFLNAGPGIRLNICDKIDFGLGGLISLTDDDFIGEALRAEFRWRF